LCVGLSDTGTRSGDDTLIRPAPDDALLTNISRAVEGNGRYFDYPGQVKYRWQQALEFGALRAKYADPIGCRSPVAG
jgi:hypothetical protein